MSGVGAVLVQPQRLRRAASASPAGGLLEDIRIVAARMGADALAGGHMADVIGAALDDAAQRMIDRATGAARAQARLLELAAPLVDGLRAQVTDLTAATGPDDVVEGIQELVDSVTKAAAGLETQSVRSFVAEVLDILETDLRLTPAAVLGDLDALFDDVVERLGDVAAEPDPAARKRRLDTARALRRIRRRLDGIDVPLPELDATRLGDEIVEFLNRYGLETQAARVACVGRNVGSGFRVGTRVLEVVPFTGFAAGSLGAAANGVTDDRLCWYATWLMKGKRRAWYQSLLLGREEEVWVEAAANRIVLKTPGEDDVVLATGTTDWTQASIFKATTPLETLRQLGLEAHYTIADPIGADALEKTAYWTAVLGKVLEMVLHLISLEPGDYASNTLHASASLATTIYELVQHAPFPWWFDFLTWLGSLFTTLEGIHTNATAWNCFTLWITLAGPDMIEAYIYRAVVGTIRDFILSLLTLVNHEPPKEAGAPRPQNRKEVDGVAEVGSILTNKLLMILVPAEDYTIPGMGGTGHALRLLLGWNLLGGAVAGAMGGFLGALLAKGIADTDDWPEFGRKIGFSMLKTGLLFFPSLNMEKEGKTSDGTYNPYPSPNDTAFLGYPAAASSPYNLPYEAGRLEYVDQANQGLFSHNFLNVSQVYSYDFALDEGVEILACRPGTVVAWGDQTDDNTTGTWNFIIIKHDVDNVGAAAGPDGVHDLGPGGTPVHTYAIYGHGRKNSVRELFAGRSITPAMLDAGGVKVKRGQPIMRSGDTGMSFHNHLHLHVVPDDGSGGRADFSIPFVFQEVSRLMDTDGVCTRFNFYRSTNTKV